MDEEKNDINIPDDEQSDVGSGVENAAQDESPPEDSAESPGDDIGNDAAKPSVSEDDLADIVAQAEREAAAEEAAKAESGGDAADGADDYLSQDQIDSVLGGLGDGDDGSDGSPISSGGLPDMGNLGVDDTDVKQADFQQLSSSGGDDGPRNIDLLMDVELPVSIELGKTKMRISDILGLGPGSIVELDKLVGEPVDLLVNKKCVARGEVVVVEESFGLRITMLVSPEERLKNLQ